MDMFCEINDRFAIEMVGHKWFSQSMFFWIKFSSFVKTSYARIEKFYKICYSLIVIDVLLLSL